MKDTPSRWIRWPAAILALLVAALMGLRVAELPREPYLGMSDRAGIVGLVAPVGPAARAGLRVGDRILAVDGASVTGVRNLPSLLRRGGPGRDLRLAVERDSVSFEVSLRAEALPPVEIIWLLAHALVAAGTLFIGTAVFLRKSGRLTGAFYGLCAALSLLLFRPWVPAGPTGDQCDALIREVVSALFPGMLLHFFLLFPWERAPVRRWPALQFLPYLPAFLLLATPRILPFLAEGTAAEQRSVSILVDLAGGWYGLAALALSVVLFWNAYRASPLPTVRRKLKVTLGGTILGFLPLLGVLAAHLAFPNAHLPADRLATLAVFLLPASFGYAILRHGIFDTEFLVKRGLAWSAVTAIAVLAYLGLYISLRAVFHADPVAGSRIGGGLAVIFVVLLMSPLRSRMQERMDRWIDPDRSDTTRAVREAGLVLRGATGLDETELATLQAARGLLGTARAGFFRPIEGDWGFRLTHLLAPAPDAAAPGEPPPPGEEPAPAAEATLGRLAADTLFGLGRPAARGEFEAELPYGYLPRADLEALAALKAKMLMPLYAGERRLGILVLGPRAFGTPYADADRVLLEGLQTQAALALETAHYRNETEAREGLHRELALAGSIQQQLLPRKLPAFPGFDIAASTVPCREIGGDFYDCLSGGPGDLALAIGDVTGKGVPAALVMASLQATFRAELASGLPPRDSPRA